MNICFTRILLVGLLVALAMPPEAGCQESGVPGSVGMSAQRLEQITVEAENQIKKGNLVGIVSLVARRGKIVYLQAVGRQHREKGIPMKKDTIFRIASFTKPVTSLAVLMLYEEGKIHLTDPISQYIPEFEGVKVVTPQGVLEDSHRPITIYDLLTHNSGLAYHDHEVIGHRYYRAAIACGLYADDDPIGEDIRKLAGIPLAKQPGSGFQYGLNTDVLGRLVEVVSGNRLWRKFFEQRLFAPLDMKDTKFFLEDADIPRLAQLYVRDGRTRLPRRTVSIELSLVFRLAVAIRLLVRRSLTLGEEDSAPPPRITSISVRWCSN